MKQSYYLYKSGKLKRKDNTLEIEYKDNTKKAIPIERVDDIYVMTEFDFNTNLLNFTYINEKARKEITKEIDSRLQTTIKHRTLGREVSYEYLIRLEVYKFIKSLLEDIPYEGFKMWW